MFTQFHKLRLYWPALAMLVSISMLAAAHAFEHFGGLAPCELCYRQREVYWVALTLGLIVTLMQRFIYREGLLRTGIMLIGLVFLTGGLIAGYHSGVEWHFWPGPSTCTGDIKNLAHVGKDLLNALSKPAEIVPCDVPQWKMFGISMAGYNTLLSLFLAGTSFALVWPKGEEQREL